VRNSGTTHEQSATSIQPLTANTKGSFHLPPAVVSIKSTSPRINRARGGASQVSIHADALKDQMPVLREIYENPLENTGRDQSKKRRKSKKNRTTRVNNESAIHNSGAQSKSQIPGFIENYQRKNETPMRSGSKMTTI
jgi:hypothetical protein